MPARTHSGSVALGEDASFTIRIQNDGPDVAEQVVRARNSDAGGTHSGRAYVYSGAGT